MQCRRHVITHQDTSAYRYRWWHPRPQLVHVPPRLLLVALYDAIRQVRILGGRWQPAGHLRRLDHVGQQDLSSLRASQCGGQGPDPFGTVRTVHGNKQPLVAQSGQISRSALISAHDHDGRPCPHDDFLHHTANVPSSQAALAMAAQNDEIHTVVVREIDDLFCGVAFQRSSLKGQAGFLQSVGQAA